MNDRVSKLIGIIETTKPGTNERKEVVGVLEGLANDLLVLSRSLQEIEGVRKMKLKDAIQSLATEYDLTQKEAEILNLLTHGYSNADVASHLWIQEKTVKNHVQNILRKMNIHGSSRPLYSKIIFKLLG